MDPVPVIVEKECETIQSVQIKRTFLMLLIQVLISAFLQLEIQEKTVIKS